MASRKFTPKDYMVVLFLLLALVGGGLVLGWMFFRFFFGQGFW